MGTWSTIGEFAKDPYRIELDEPVRSLRLSAITGRINIVGTDGPAAVEVTKATEQPVQLSLEHGELVVKHGEDHRPGLFTWLLSLGTPGRRMTVDLSLALPPDCLLDVKLISGPVMISNFHERVSVRGVSGDVTLAEVHGRAKVQTVSGAITVEQTTGDLTVKALSGEITVVGGVGGTIDAAATSGAITVDLDDPLPSSVRLQCLSGAIKVRLPHEANVDVDLLTTNGRVASTFPGLTVNREGPGGGRRLRGQVGDGSAGRATLFGKTISGSVTLLRRDPRDDESEPEDAVVEDARPSARAADSAPARQPTEPDHSTTDHDDEDVR